MKYTSEKLASLKKELTSITKEVENGKITPRDAADKIISLREEIDKVIAHLKTLKP